MRITLCVLACAVWPVLVLRAQSEIKPVTAQTAQEVFRWYNQGKIDSIYDRLDSTMKAGVSRATLNDVYQKQLKPLGVLAGLVYEETQQGVDRYKGTTLSGTLLSFYLRENKDRQLSAFGIRPYEYKRTTKRDSLYNDNALLTSLDSLVHRTATGYMKDRMTEGMSIAIQQGPRVFYYNYGLAKPATEQHPTNRTQYEIGSITKTMVSFLLADAVTSGKIKLTDPILPWLPEEVRMNKALEGIQWVHLSNHSSGLPRLAADYMRGNTNAADPYAQYSKEYLFEYLKTATLTTPPGKTYAYSNLAVGLLGVLLERVYKQPLDQLLQEKLFTPLKMADTYLSLNGKPRDTTMLARGHDAQGKPVAYWTFSSMAGAGAVVSTAQDMARYMAYLTLRPRTKGRQDARVLLMDSITFQQQEVSLAWHWRKAEDGGLLMEHSGGTYGFRSHIVLSQEKKTGVFVVINSGEDPGATLPANQLMDALYRKETAN